ncbi:MAG: chromate transporter [Lachnospiraceae bacterium]|nr:chromate transporter [Lachnospiraceae bacterium]
MSNKYLLFIEFFKTGLFAIGGGPATIPFLMDMAKKYPWFSMAELSDMIAISESTPGPVGLNMATYAGFKTLGTFGGIVSTLALTIPSIVIILIIARFLEGFQDNKIVKAVFAGIKPAVTALIAVAVMNIFKVSLFDISDSVITPRISSMIIAVVIFVLIQWPKTKKLHPALWFLFAALIGIIFRL